MTQEEKAQELGQKYFPNEMNIWARPNYEACACEQSCLEMAEWQKQQMIEKAVEWLRDNTSSYIDFEAPKYGGSVELDTENLIDDFKKAMNVLQPKTQAS